MWFGQGHVRAENLDFDSVTSAHTINLYGEREREMTPCFPGEPGSDDPLASEATSSQLM